MEVSTHRYPPDTLWFAAWTRSRQEKSASTMLDSLGIPHFLPVKREKHKWSDRSKTVVTPLFSGYLFVRLNPAKDSRLQVLKTPGIVGLVGNQAGPLPVPDSEIASIQAVLQQQVKCQPHSFFAIGDRVRVTRGALAGVEGTLVRSHSDWKLVVSIEMIQQSIAIEIHASDLEHLQATAS